MKNTSQKERLSVNLAAQEFRIIKTKERMLRKGYSDNYQLACNSRSLFFLASVLGEGGGDFHGVVFLQLLLDS